MLLLNDGRSVLIACVQQTGEPHMSYVQIHDLDQPITDLQFGPLDEEQHVDRTYFVTACKDKTSKVCCLVCLPEN